MEEVIKKWELILQQDSGRNITYDRKVLKEMLTDVKMVAKNLHKPLVSGQVCDHDYQRVYRDQESMFVCTKCHKRQGYEQTCY